MGTYKLLHQLLIFEKRKKPEINPPYFTEDGRIRIRNAVQQYTAHGHKGNRFSAI